MSDASKKIAMLQTSDAERYLPMLQLTSEVNARYCGRHKIDYQQWMGIKRGYHPWHACFNRIVLLKEMIDAGNRNWVFYLDADAFIVDLSFDVRRIIAGVRKPIIMAASGASQEVWDVNDGVFLIDLGDDTARDLVLAWYGDFMTTSDELLKIAAEWDGKVASDQPRLQSILQRNERFRNALGTVDRGVLNHHRGSFVRQILRTNASSLEERTALVRKQVMDVLNGAPLVPICRDDVIRAYRFVLRREPENEKVIQHHMRTSEDLSELIIHLTFSREHQILTKQVLTAVN